MTIVINELNKLGWFVNENKLEYALGDHYYDGIDKEKLIKLLLDTDIKDYGDSVLSNYFNRQKGELQTPIILQLIKWRNVSKSKINEHNGNDGVCKLSLSDGFSTVECLQINAPININGDTPYGSKILLQNTINYESGYLILEPKNCKFLGGNVEKLVEKWKYSKMSGVKLNKYNANYPRFEVFKTNNKAPIKQMSKLNIDEQQQKIKQQNLATKIVVKNHLKPATDNEFSLTSNDKNLGQTLSKRGLNIKSGRGFSNSNRDYNQSTGNQSFDGCQNRSIYSNIIQNQSNNSNQNQSNNYNQNRLIYSNQKRSNNFTPKQSSNFIQNQTNNYNQNRSINFNQNQSTYSNMNQNQTNNSTQNPSNNYNQNPNNNFFSNQSHNFNQNYNNLQFNMQQSMQSSQMPYNNQQDYNNSNNLRENNNFRGLPRKFYINSKRK